MGQQDALVQVRQTVIERVVAAGNMIQPLLPEHVEFNKVLAQMNKHLRENPKLCECTPASLFWAFVHAAEIGLSVGDFFGEAYILGFGSRSNEGAAKRARCVPGYRGLLKLAYQSRLIGAIDAWVIYETDRFEAQLGRDKDPVIYVPCLAPPDSGPGKAIAVYTKIQLTTGSTKHHVMPRWRLEQVRKGSPGARDSGHPWNTHTDEMYRKTGLRHALKDAPKSNEADRALMLDERADNDNEDGDDMPDIPGLEEPTRSDASRTSRSRDRVQSRAAALPAPVVVQAPPAAPPAQPAVVVQPPPAAAKQDKAPKQQPLPAAPPAPAAVQPPPPPAASQVPDAPGWRAKDMKVCDECYRVIGARLQTRCDKCSENALSRVPTWTPDFLTKGAVAAPPPAPAQAAAPADIPDPSEFADDGEEDMFT